MAVLLASQKATLQSLADYLQGAPNLPIPTEVVEKLALIFAGTSGFPCACGIRGNSLRDGFRDEPVRTFLRLLIAVGTAAPAGAPLIPTPNGPLAP